MVMALKEWGAICRALLAGSHLLVLRKGGLDEQGGRFRLPARRFWLCPSRAHERPELLAASLRPLAGSASILPPGRLRLPGWAEVAAVRRTLDPAVLEALGDEQPFAPAYAATRLRWKPREPLWILLLRAHRVGPALEVQEGPGDAGCSSWLTLTGRAPEPAGGEPALPDDLFAQRRAQILAALQAAGAEPEEV